MVKEEIWQYTVYLKFKEKEKQRTRVRWEKNIFVTKDSKTNTKRENIIKYYKMMARNQKGEVSKYHRIGQ